MYTVCFHVLTSLATCVRSDFVAKNYAALVESNKFPILVRECSGVQPRLLGRFGVYFFGMCD